MTEKELKRIEQRLMLMERDFENHKRWLNESLACIRAHMCAHASTSAHVEGGAKESKERDIPPTPPIEKETKENLTKNKNLIDSADPSASRRDQSIAPVEDEVLIQSARDAAEVQSGSLEPTEAEVVAFAENVMGVPSWYARWWHRYMVSVGWTTNRGERVDRKNWRPLMKTWWRNCREDEREAIRREITEGVKPTEDLAALRERLLAENERMWA